MPKNYHKTVGRKERKNLVKLDNGNVKNQHGVTFTDKEKRALESAVNQANAKRAKQLKEAGKLPRYENGKPSGDTLATKLQSGFESDFIIAKKSKSLQRFNTKTEYNKYMRYLKRVNSGEYLNDRTRLYKRNYMEAIKRSYPESDDILMKVRMMKPEKFRELIESEQLPEIKDVYPTKGQSDESNILRAKLGMKLKEDDDFYNYDDIEGG